MQQKLTITVPVDSVMSVAPLPDAVVGVPYSQQVQASGGIPPYTFAMVSGPAGIALSPSGLLSGIPAVPVTITFTVMDSGV